MNNRRFKVIACNVMWRELAYHAALSPHAFNLQFLDWGLHTEPDRLEGDAGLIRRLVNGDWDGGDFLIVEPGHAIRASNDEAVLCAVADTSATE